MKRLNTISRGQLFSNKKTAALLFAPTGRYSTNMTEYFNSARNHCFPCKESADVQKFPAERFFQCSAGNAYSLWSLQVEGVVDLAGQVLPEKGGSVKGHVAPETPLLGNGH